MKSVLLLTGLEFLSFLIVTINFRACAKGRMRTTVITDVLLSALGFTLTKLVAEAKTTMEMVGYVAGAAGGSVSGMWLTRHWKDEEHVG